MKKLKMRSITFLLAFALLAALLPVMAADSEVIASGECGDQGNNITWELTSDGTLTLTGSGKMKNNISFAPWKNYVENISNVIINEKITSIGVKAFKGCSALTRIDLPAGITVIGNSAFENCTSLSNVVFPASLESIGEWAFAGCTLLDFAELPEGLTWVGGSAFEGCKSLVSLKELPAGITWINGQVFKDCASLNLEKLPEGVQSIGSNAFNGCKSLALTELPESVFQIGAYAFEGCSSLCLKKLPAGLTIIEPGTFYKCTSLALMELPRGITRIGKMAFSHCAKIALTELPPEITYIGNSAFRFCTSLALTELPNKFTSIFGDSFLGATWRIKTEHYIPDKDGGYMLQEITDSLVVSGETAEANEQDYSTLGLISADNENQLLAQTVPTYIYNGQAIVLRRYYDVVRIIVTIKDDTGGSTIQEIPYGGKATEPELEEKPGYKVTWVTENGEHFDFDTPITEPITIHPVWAPVGAIHGSVVDNQGKPVPDAHIAIVAGNTNYLETDADANGHFWIYDVPYGSYDMVTSKRALTVTALFELDHTLEEVTVTLPDAQTNSILEVNQGTKDVVVGGLDTLFNSEIYNEADKETVANGGSVTVKMTVKAVKEEDIPDSAQELNAAAAADGKTIFGYMEMDVAKITETAAGENTEENIPELPQLLQIIDPLSEEQKGKTGYVVYRMHEGTVYPITETPNVNGAYITVSDDTLTIYASKFSAYCLAFDTVTKPDSGGGKPTPIVTPDDDDDDDDDGWRNPFIDVKPDDWFYKDVLDAYHAGYMEGVTSNTFKPNAPLTRAQAAYTFVKVAKAELKGLEITGDFEDVTSRTTYANAITWANDTGVEIGYGNGNFGPTDSLTREQLALMLYRTYGNGEEILTWEGDFSDLEDVSNWSEEAVRWAIHVGLLEGTDGGKLLPQGTVTRAEATALIMRLIKKG